MDLQGPRVAVLGGTSGIGRATAALLADQGADVVAAGRSEDKVAQTVAALPAVRGEQVDATDRGQLDALFDRLGEIATCARGSWRASLRPFRRSPPGSGRRPLTRYSPTSPPSQPQGRS